MLHSIANDEVLNSMVISTIFEYIDLQSDTEGVRTQAVEETPKRINKPNQLPSMHQ